MGFVLGHDPLRIKLLAETLALAPRGNQLRLGTMPAASSGWERTLPDKP